MAISKPLYLSWGIRVNPLVKYLLSFLGNLKLAKSTPFAVQLNKQETTRVDEVEKEDWWTSTGLAKSDSVYVEVLESSKLLLSNETNQIDYLTTVDKDFSTPNRVEDLGIFPKIGEVFEWGLGPVNEFVAPILDQKQWSKPTNADRFLKGVKPTTLVPKVLLKKDMICEKVSSLFYSKDSNANGRPKDSQLSFEVPRVNDGQTLHKGSNSPKEILSEGFPLIEVEGISGEFKENVPQKAAKDMDISFLGIKDRDPISYASPITQLGFQIETRADEMLKKENLPLFAADWQWH